jgi:hypothetical protein
VRVLALHEIHARVRGILELVRLPELVIAFERFHGRAPAQHRLEHEQVAHHAVVQDVQREQRMTQVVEDTHEQHDVEPFSERRQLVHRELVELDIEVHDVGGEPRLCKVARVGVDAHHARRAAALHLETVESRVAPDVEHRLAGQIRGKRVREALPFDGGVIAEEVIRRRLDAAQIDVVKPVAQLANAIADGVGRQAGDAHRIAFIEAPLKRRPTSATPAASAT